MIAAITEVPANGKVMKIMGAFIFFNSLSQCLDSTKAYSPKAFPAKIIRCVGGFGFLPKRVWRIVRYTVGCK